MRTSESTVKLTPALVAVQEEMVAVKDSKNPHFKNGYASLDCILSTIKPSLKENGLVVMQTTQLKEGGIIECVTRISHASGEWIESECVVPIDKNTPQGYGSTLTYARRYGVALALGIGTMDDDDGNAAEEAVRKKQAKEHFKRIQKKAADRLKEIDLACVQKAFGEADIETLDKDNIPYSIEELCAKTKDEAQLMEIGKRAVALSKEEPAEEEPEPAKKKAPVKKKAEPEPEPEEDPEEEEAEEEESEAPDAEEAEEEETEEEEAEEEEEESSYVEPEGPDANIKATKPVSHQPKDDEVADDVYVDYIVDFFCKMIERTITHEMLSQYCGKKDTEWDKKALDKLFSLYKQLNEGSTTLAEAFPDFYEG